jgi:hypothetical protein
MICAAREVVNKQLASWRNEAIVDVSHDEIIVRDRNFRTASPIARSAEPEPLMWIAGSVEEIVPARESESV